MKIYQKKNCKWVIDFTYKNRRIRRVVGESKRDVEAAMIRIKNDILIEKYGFTKPKKAILFLIEPNPDGFKKLASVKTSRHQLMLGSAGAIRWQTADPRPETDEMCGCPLVYL